MANDFLRQTLDHYRQQKVRLLEQLRPIDVMIRQIELELDESSVESPVIDLFAGAGGFGAISTDPIAERRSTTNGKRLDVRGDEFFGKSQAEASRNYLTRVGHAVPLEELVEVLNSGGCPVGGADPKKTLYIALLRNSKDFVRIPNNGHVGLRSMYPGLKAAPKTPQPKSKPKKKARSAVKAQTKTAEKPKRITAAPKPATVMPLAESSEPKHTRPPSPIKVTMLEVLADGQLRSADEIVEAVREKVGPIQGFTVHGILKQKEFEKVDNQYRLVK